MTRQGIEPWTSQVQPGALTTELFGQDILACLEWFNPQVLDYCTATASPNPVHSNKAQAWESIALN